MTPPCRHLHTSGRPCGSPALRGEPFCFHHHAARKPMPQRDLGGLGTSATPQLPAPDDFLAIQRGLGEVLRLLALDKLTDRRAQTLLNGLAKASANLARHLRHEEKLAALALADSGDQAEAQPNAQPNARQPVTAFVNDPVHGTIALDPNEAARQAQPIPDPIPLLTPDPSRTTSYDDAMAVEIHRQFETIYRRQTQAFEAAKEAELHTLYEDRYAEREQDLEDRLEAQFEAQFEARLEAQFAQQLEATLKARLHPPYAQKRSAYFHTPPQQNQYLRINPQKLLQAPPQRAA